MHGAIGPLCLTMPQNKTLCSHPPQLTLLLWTPRCQSQTLWAHSQFAAVWTSRKRTLAGWSRTDVGPWAQMDVGPWSLGPCLRATSQADGAGPCRKWVLQHFCNNTIIQTRTFLQFIQYKIEHILYDKTVIYMTLLKVCHKLFIVKAGLVKSAYKWFQKLLLNWISESNLILDWTNLKLVQSKHNLVVESVWRSTIIFEVQMSGKGFVYTTLSFYDSSAIHITHAVYCYIIHNILWYCF
jgi:hypothetical protein